MSRKDFIKFMRMLGADRYSPEELVKRIKLIMALFNLRINDLGSIVPANWICYTHTDKAILELMEDIINVDKDTNNSTKQSDPTADSNVVGKRVGRGKKKAE